MEERILVVGTGDTARKVVRQILDQREFAYRVIGFIDDDASRIGERIVNPGIVGTPADMAALIATHQIDRIVVGLSDRRGKLPIEELLRAKMAGIRVEDATTTYERVTGKILHRRPASELADLLRRLPRVADDPLDEALDRSHAVAGARRPRQPADAPDRDRDPASSPAGRCSTARSGSARTARSFTLCKFRSMRQDAEKGGTPIWATDGDNRITRVGRFIRKTRLDELPQIWNVLLGAMSFVGPRPERPYFVAELAKEIPFYQQRHAVKPGLTGWAQVKYRYGASLEDAMEKLRYDLYYIKHLSVFFDLTIVFDTVKVVLFRKGAA